VKAPRLHFHGAAGGVTGSCFRLEFGGTQVLVDCGLFQGAKSEKELNYRPFPFAVHAIGAVVLTHAHIDHSGLLPKLIKAGFDGPVHATRATADLCGAMLPDSAHVQEIEVSQLNRRNRSRGRDTVREIYTSADAVAALDSLRRLPYGRWFDVVHGIRGRFWNAGHLLGSASVELELARAKGNGLPLRILFSGDIGPAHKLMQAAADGPVDLDYVVCESTYGDSDREATEPARRRSLLRQEVERARNVRGVLLIPSFAVERTQELLIDLHQLMRDGDIAKVPVFIDSPLAQRASAIFDDHADEIPLGAVLREAFRSGNVRFTHTAEQSKAIARVQGFHIVIAASGMCEAGRIRHHLKNWLWRDEATVLLVGYQAQGTLGRILQDGAPRVRIQGEEIQVRARIRSIDLYSGHADGPELAEWVQKRQPVHAGVFLVHGEEPAVAALGQRLAALMPGVKLISPSLDEGYELGDTEAVRLESSKPPRIAPGRAGHQDWHNDLSALLLDINETMEKSADERSRATVIRRLRRALTPDAEKPS